MAILGVSDIIYKNIKSYLGIDPMLLLKGTDYAYIFGGALRDSVVGDPINDIDILCLPRSYKKVCENLEEMGFRKFDMSSMDISTMYSELEVIFTPTTYINEEVIVQLIRPKVPSMHENVFSGFFSLLTNVDISCCGLYLDANYQIKECYNNALIHILCKVYEINENALMYNQNRIDGRTTKLDMKGWKHLPLVLPEELEERKKEMEKMLWREHNINELTEQE